MLRPSMSISRFWHYQQLMLQLQMAIWKLAPSIYVLSMHVDMVISSQVYVYLLRFIDPSCNPRYSCQLNVFINAHCYHIYNIPIGFSDLEYVGVNTKCVFYDDERLR